MRKVLFVLSNLEYGSLAGQLVQLATALPGDHFECRVCVLGRIGPWADRLRRSGIEVHAPGRGQLFELKPLAELRELVRSFSPDVLHVWGLPALRAVALSGFKGRLLASPCPRHDFARSWLRRLDGWLLRQASHVVALGNTEAARCRLLGVEADKLVVLDPAVSVEEPASTLPDVLEGRRFLLCVGPLKLYKGIQDAVWAHDILRYVHPDLHLAIAGTGPECERLRPFIAGIESTGFVHFLGAVPEVFSLMRRAEVVWSPGRMETGTQVVLEAMAAGKPVIACRFPRLEELIVEGETGFLFPAEDKPALARQTQVLLNDPAMRERMGEATRKRVEKHFRPDTLAERCSRLYKG